MRKEYVISESTKKRIEEFLYRELEVDNTCVEVNELLDALENAKTLDNTYMWEKVMFKEAKECLDIVSQQIGEELTEKQKKQILKEYVYDTTACTVYNYPIMKRTIKRIVKEKKSA